LCELVLYDLWKKYFWRWSRNKCHEWSNLSYQPMIWYQNSTKLKRKIHWFFTASHHHRSKQFRDSTFFVKKLLCNVQGWGRGNPKGPTWNWMTGLWQLKMTPLTGDNSSTVIRQHSSMLLQREIKTKKMETLDRKNYNTPIRKTSVDIHIHNTDIQEERQSTYIDTLIGR